MKVITESRIDVVDVTQRVAEGLPNIDGGVCTVFVEHTTAAVSINEAEPRLLDDIETFVSGLSAPEGWKHDALDDNADSHLRSSLIGRSVCVPVRDGKLALGTWQSILLIEFDGPRTRSLSVMATPSVE
ncbi:MAG: secondary thiamine-phosphate synthase enzyme YjbQ [Halobacteriota archaeon]|uniref:secondary thiamine-phosphate synthase enzyme YjbQ n=1 Tax=Natronomonas sp. TaxID=2184060 RepID=UPI00397669EC